MHGSVVEWCQDWAGSYDAEPVTDPQGPSAGTLRVGRGGSMGVGAAFCRAADRSAAPPSNRGYDLGFRVCVGP